MPRTDADAGIRLSELRHVVADLAGCVGAHVQQVWVPDPTTVVLAWSDGRQVLLSHWPVPRVHGIAKRPRNPKMPLSFQGLLRQRLKGPLTDVRVDGDDRVVSLVFGEHTLHVRLFGRGGGIWWLEGERAVASSEGPCPPTLPPLPDARLDDGPPRFGPLEGSWLDGAARFFQGATSAWHTRALRTRLLRHLKALHKKQKRLHDNLLADLEAAERADTLRRHADGLAAVLHTVARGSASVVVPDLHGEAETLHVALDPTRSPAENMNRLYDKARRLERAVDQILTRIDAAEATLAELQEARTVAPEASLRELRALAKAWHLPDVAARSAPTHTVLWTTWRGPGGAQVRVGRTDKANHALVTRGMRGRDWWFHLKNQPSAHAVLVWPSADTTPSLDQLLAVSQVLLHHTKVAPDESVDVQYARGRHVRPIKSAGPGKVTVHGDRVLRVTRSREAMQAWRRES